LFGKNKKKRFIKLQLFSLFEDLTRLISIESQPKKIVVVVVVVIGVVVVVVHVVDAVVHVVDIVIPVVDPRNIP